jgi:hypothetical protein
MSDTLADGFDYDAVSKAQRCMVAPVEFRLSGFALAGRVVGRDRRCARRRRGLGGPALTSRDMEVAIAKLSPPLPDWRAVPESWFDPARSEAFTNEFTRQLSVFRDEHMLRNLVAAVRGGERVFAVVGSSHVIMQERALKAALR